MRTFPGAARGMAAAAVRKGFSERMRLPAGRLAARLRPVATRLRPGCDPVAAARKRPFERRSAIAFFPGSVKNDPDTT